MKKLAGLAMLILGDLTALGLAFGLAEIVRRILREASANDGLPSGRWPLQSILRLAALAAIWILAFASEKLYTRRFSSLDESRRLLKGSSTAFAVVLGASFLNPGFFLFSRTTLLIAWIPAFALFPLFRGIIKRTMARRRLWRKRVLFIGSSGGAGPVIKAIRSNPILGYEMVGVLTDDRPDPEAFDGLPVLGRIDDLEAWAERKAFDHLVIHFPDLPGDQLTERLGLWETAGEVIHYIPRTAALIVAGVEAEDMGGVLSLSVRRNLAKPWNILIKSAFDYILAGIGFVVTAPLLLLAMAAVKLDSRGPVFFRQIRYGRMGRPIRLIKLRTMHVDNEKRREAFLAGNPAARAEWAEYHKLKAKDPRITRIGRFLRRTSLDEIPQLLNVLTGEMSLVGPRPYLIEELREMEKARSILTHVKPGLSGLWQVSGRSLVPFHERLSLDEHYVRNWSFWLDIIILVKTPLAALLGRGAF
ncbi:MAG: sugar transferase [Acidobacteriota bacterium]|nr:sugar transferase [Acidobacteriota bacterium]